MLNFIFIAVLAYGVLLGVLYGFQRKLMYHPATALGSPADYGLSGFTPLRLRAQDGTQLTLWYRKAEAGKPTVLYFHGNAGHIGDRAPMYRALAGHGFGVLALSYRGYGTSEGSPSEQGIYQDARAAIGYLTQQEHLAPGNIILYGESLGTGVAVQMATEFPIGLLALQAPYRSVVQRAAELYPYVPVSLLLKDRFDSLAKIGQVRAPLLLFHGLEDEVIPVAHGKAVFEAANEPKQAFFLPGVQHNDFDSATVCAHLLAYATSHHLLTP